MYYEWEIDVSVNTNQMPTNRSTNQSISNVWRLTSSFGFDWSKVIRPQNANLQMLNSWALFTNQKFVSNWDAETCEFPKFQGTPPHPTKTLPQKCLSCKDRWRHMTMIDDVTFLIDDVSLVVSVRVTAQLHQQLPYSCSKTQLASKQLRPSQEYFDIASFLESPQADSGVASEISDNLWLNIHPYQSTLSRSMTDQHDT